MDKFSPAHYAAVASWYLCEIQNPEINSISIPQVPLTFIAWHFFAQLSPSIHISYLYKCNRLFLTTFDSSHTQSTCALSILHTNNIHPAKLVASFPSSLCTLSTFNASVQLPCNNAFCMQASYNKPFSQRENLCQL